MYLKDKMFCIHEYSGVHHVVISLTNNPSNPANIRAAYNTIATYLKFEKVPNLGATILLTEEWMFVALLSDPVTKVHSKPVFIDPLAYAGIMNVNIEEFEWP